MTNTPKYRQQWIFDLLKSENLSYTDMFSRHSLNFTKSKQTFNKDWKVAVEMMEDYQNRANKAKDDASIAVEVKAVKRGLKTKLDRVMFYQDQIDEMEKQLYGETEFYFIVGNKPLTSHPQGVFKLPIEKQNEIRKQIKEYQIEISRIEGDYEKDNRQKVIPARQIVNISDYKKGK